MVGTQEVGTQEEEIQEEEIEEEGIEGSESKHTASWLLDFGMTMHRQSKLHHRTDYSHMRIG